MRQDRFNSGIQRSYIPSLVNESEFFPKKIESYQLDEQAISIPLQRTHT